MVGAASAGAASDSTVLRSRSIILQFLFHCVTLRVPRLILICVISVHPMCCLVLIFLVCFFFSRSLCHYHVRSGMAQATAAWFDRHRDNIQRELDKTCAQLTPLISEHASEWIPVTPIVQIIVSYAVTCRGYEIFEHVRDEFLNPFIAQLKAASDSASAQNWARSLYMQYYEYVCLDCRGRGVAGCGAVQCGASVFACSPNFLPSWWWWWWWWWWQCDISGLYGGS